MCLNEVLTQAFSGLFGFPDIQAPAAKTSLALVDASKRPTLVNRKRLVTGLVAIDNGIDTVQRHFIVEANGIDGQMLLAEASGYRIAMVVHAFGADVGHWNDPFNRIDEGALFQLISQAPQRSGCPSDEIREVSFSLEFQYLIIVGQIAFPLSRIPRGLSRG